MAKYRIVLDFETDDNITLGMITRGLEYNDCPIRNEMFSEYPNIVGDCAVSYKIVEAKEMTVKRNVEELLDKNICYPLFSVRAVNCLHAADVQTVRELVRLERDYVKNLRNIGRNAFNEIEQFLKDNNLYFGMDV